MTAALGIDTSCYTTSVALASNGKILLQERRLLPVPQGERGLRQSEAVFVHTKQLPELMEKMMAKAECDVTCVCASASPRDGQDSYMPVFVTGLSAARTVASVLRVPLFTTTHQRGHVRAALYESGMEERRDEPYLTLHLSGGTTDVLLVKDGLLSPIGSSLDLHAGQMVDRIGVKLGLPFPCGPYLEEMAGKGLSTAMLPVSMEGTSCHLSGAESMLERSIDAGLSPNDAAAEVYNFLCRVVLRMLSAAKEKTDVSRCLLAGGVASSSLLRELLLLRNQKQRCGLELYFGKQEYSGDNAAGVALLGWEQMMKGVDKWQQI